MSNLPNSIIRLVPPSLRGGYCPDSWQEFANELVCGTQAQHSASRGTTFYNFGKQSPYPPAPTPEPPQPPAGACGECPPQDMLVDWEPTNIDFGAMLTLRYRPDFVSYPNTPSLNCISYEQASSTALFDITEHDYLQEARFPNLVNGNQIVVTECPLVTLVDLPVLEEATGIGIRSYYYQYANIGLYIVDNASLVSLNLSASFVPTNGKSYYFSFNALPSSNVDSILCIFAAALSYVSGTLDVSNNAGGPTATGIACANTLTARGVTVLT
jgi:hypothetical protein